MEENLLLDEGNYTVSARSCDFSAPLFDTPQYGDTQVASVKAGKTTVVTLVCAQLNSGIRRIGASQTQVVRDGSGKQFHPLRHIGNDPCHFLIRYLRHWSAEQPYLAACRVIGVAQQTQNGAFPCSGSADDSKNGALGDGKIQLFQCALRLIVGKRNP